MTFMKTTISAGFENPDHAGAALGRLQRAGIPLYRCTVTDISPVKYPHGPWESGSIRLGSYKTLFLSPRDGDKPTADVFERGSLLTVETDREKADDTRHLLCNSRAFEIKVRS